MSDWDQDSDDGAAPAAPAKPVVLPPRRGGKFDDEDVEEEVKDDWEEEDEAPAPAPVVAPPKKKGTVKQKIAEKEAEERRRAELGVESDEDVPEEDAAARRRAERDAQIKADLDNAANLLGTSKIADDSSSLRNAKPASKEDWESFASELYTTLIRKQASRPGFDKHFVPFLCGLLASEGLRDVDMRKLSTRWKELADDKVKNDKEAKRLGGKKPVAATAKPKSVGTSSAKNVIDTRAYGDEALDDGDDLDFM